MSGIGVQLEHVSLELGGRRVLRDVALDVPPGAKLLLLGANGAGKTQLLKLLAGERWPTPTRARRERREYVDARGRALALPDLLPRIAFVGGERQDKYHRYEWNFAVEYVVGTGCHGTDRQLQPLTAAERTRVRGVLRRLGLEPLRERRFLTLSYGERRLVLLARALAGRPRLLLLDEPYNGLDTRARTVLGRELTRLARTQLTIVTSAHRAEDAPGAFREVAVIERGRVAYRGPRARAPAAWLAPPATDATAVPKAASSPRGSGRATPSSPRAPRARGQALPPFVALRGVDLYRDWRPVLANLDWTIAAGEHWAIVGPNGAGKSTLLKLLYGDLHAALGGVVERRGHPPGSHVQDWRRRVGWVSPELQGEYLDDLSVAEVVASGLRSSIGLLAPASARELARARGALARVGLASAAARRFRALSYGQRRLALVARALVHAPEALLLDEPLTGLDAPARARMRRLLSRLARDGVQLVVAVHHPEDLVPEIRRVLRLRNGRAIAGTR